MIIREILRRSKNKGKEVDHRSAAFFVATAVIALVTIPFPVEKFRHANGKVVEYTVREMRFRDCELD
jgi:hypothetical protein